MTVISDLETFCFNFDWPKEADQNLKHEIEFIIKNSEYLVENEIKKQLIEQLFLKYKHGNSTPENRKQKNECVT